MEKTIKQTRIRDMVEAVLRNIPESRNSDITLMIEVWRRYHNKKLLTFTHLVGDFVSTSSLYDLPREDNIKRIRAAFNAEGKYYPTDWKVAKKRGLKEDEWRNILGYPSKAETLHPTKDDSYMDEQRDFNKKSLFN